MIPLSWLIHTCTRKQRTGVSSKGDPQYGAATTFKARVEKKRAVIKQANGEEVQTQYVLATTTAIAYDDKIWLPDIAGDGADDTADDDDANMPVSVEVATDKIGNRKVYLVRF